MNKKTFPKPKIVISKCLNFERCRFNGDKVNDEFLEKLWKYVDYIPVCPEVAIGLWTPRMPVRLFKDNDSVWLYQPWTWKDYTDKMNDFSLKFLQTVSDTDGFILKNRSPSCWIWDVKIYRSKDKNSSSEGKTSWLFAQKVIEKFALVPREDEGRLKNFRLREEFLTKIFLLAEFKLIKTTWTIKDLTEFHTQNKYMLMVLDPNLLTELGQIIASYNKENYAFIIKDYSEKLQKAVSGHLKINRICNVFEHLLWYFKNHVSSEERLFFLEMIDMYRDSRVPKSSLVSLLKVWAIRTNNEYLLSQSFLNPYPEELFELSDSWKMLKL